MLTSSKNLLELLKKTSSKNDILERCKKYISNPVGFFHIVSLNPENYVETLNNSRFNQVVKTAQILIQDGVGIVLAARLLGLEAKGRYTGVDLMDDLLNEAGKGRLGVLLLGGRSKIADKIAKCYQEKYPEANFFGLEAIKDIKSPTVEEEKQITSIVRARKPRFIFVAFGSPAQEIWLDDHKTLFKGAVCMGVGGAFDYLSGSIERANPLIRKMGFEWLYRLLKQPWRWRRQLKLLNFLLLVMKEKFTS